MAKELRTIEFYITTRDMENLPEGIDADDVVTELRDVMAKAGAAWYRERGHAMLVYAPDWTIEEA